MAKFDVDSNTQDPAKAPGSTPTPTPTGDDDSAWDDLDFHGVVLPIGVFEAVITALKPPTADQPKIVATFKIDEPGREHERPISAWLHPVADAERIERIVFAAGGEWSKRPNGTKVPKFGDGVGWRHLVRKRVRIVTVRNVYNGRTTVQITWMGLWADPGPDAWQEETGIDPAPYMQGFGVYPI